MMYISCKLLYYLLDSKTIKGIPVIIKNYCRVKSPTKVNRRRISPPVQHQRTRYYFSNQ